MQYAAEATHKRVGTVGSHRLNHQSACATARKGLHDSSRYGCGKVGVDTHEGEEVCEPLFEQAHSSAGAEHTHCYEDGDEVGDNADGCFETVFSSVDKCLIYIDFADGCLNDKPADNAEQNDRCDEGRECGECFFGQALCEDKQQHHEGGEGEEYAQHDFVPYLDFLCCTAGE